MTEIMKAGVACGRVTQALIVLVGMVSAGVACAAPAIEWSRPTTLSRGITLRQAKVTEPRSIRYMAVRIDLKAPGLFLVGADRAPGYGKPLAENPGLYAKKSDGTQKKIEPAVIRTRRETVKDFVARAVKDTKSGGRGLDVALAFASSPTSLPYDSQYANPSGIIVSEGKLVTERSPASPLLVVRKNGTAAIVDTLSPSEYESVQVASTAATHVRKGGQCLVPPTRNTPGARVAAGVSKDGRYLWVLSADDGKTVTYGVGATYQELNEALASLDIQDAVNLVTGGESSVAVRDMKTGAVRTLNLGPDGREPGKCTGSIAVCYRPAGATAAAASEAKPVPPPGPEQIEGRISQARLNPSRDKSAGETTLRGQVRVSTNSDVARFKRPVLYVAALFDVEGMWRMYDVVCADQKVYWGHLLDHGQTAKQVSTWQPEVSKDAWTSILFGDVKRGFFAGYHVPVERSKLLGYRLELWQNGGLVDSYDSDRAGLRRIGVPDDWAEKGKYSGKIVYHWPPPKEKD